MEQGSLATILSAEENAFVLGLLTTFTPSVFPASSPDVRVSLGGTDGKAAGDMSGPGIYSWITGEAFGYVNWTMSGGDNEPDGTCDSCGPMGTGCHCDHRLTIGPDGHWNDRWEGYPRSFVCEAPAR